MGLLDYFRREKALTASPAVVEAYQNGQHNAYQRLGGVNQQVSAAWLQAQSASYAYMYEHQPAVRKVVDHIARNAAQLGLKLYDRVSDTERKRVTDHPAALTMDHPNDLGTADQFIFNFVADWLVHDNAYALKFRGPNGGPRVLIQVPVPAVAINSAARFTIESYRIYRSDGTYFDVDPVDVIHWRGYNPSDPRIGISKLETLRQVLAEDAASQAANTELLKSGLSKPGYIKRPLEAPDWSEDARKRFQESWGNQAKSSPRKTPVLEEGMEFADFGVSPKDAEMLAGRKFTNDEVASLYGMEHCPPTDGIERQGFYSDVLAPLVGQLASVFGFSILQAEYGEPDYYFEFDLNEKLRGEIETRFAAITASVGAPWLTRNEARAMENRPPVEGGDEIITPLNVIEGDNPRPAPNVMPPQDPNGPLQDGSHRETPKALTNGKALIHPRRAAQVERRNRYASEIQALFEAFYGRQERSVASKKALDATRWNQELADDLEKALLSTVEREGDITAQRLGLLGFDSRQVKNYLRSTAEDVAKNTNDVTRAALSEADAAEVFARARSERAVTAGMSLATSMAAFAQMEAAKQSPERRMKTWLVTSSDSEHPELDGETVPLGQSFSNGADGPPADHVGCQCALEIT